MKKFISVFLCTVVFIVNVIFTPYATTVYAAGTAVDIIKSISLDNVVKMVKSLYKVGYNVATTGSGDGAASSKALDSIWGEDSAVNKWLQTKLFPFMDTNGNIDLTNPDSPITYDKDKQLVEFNPTFTTELNQQLQDSIHVLDGYYYIEPEFPGTLASLKSHSGSYFDNMSETNINKISDALSKHTTFIQTKVAVPRFRVSLIDANNYYFYIGDGHVYKYAVDSGVSSYYFSFFWFGADNDLSFGEDSSNVNPQLFVSNRLKDCYVYGSPFKVFYTKQDLQNYLNKGRTYAPQLPSGGFKINIKYINNSVNYPDVNVNLDSLVGKVEADVQADLDLTLKNYLDHLADFTNGGGITNPTPTPSGGGSGGDFGDGTTPTPKPDFTDGSLTDTNTLLQKILDKLTEFSTNHDKLAKTITDYIQKNDGKLEEILLAIQALSDGKTETEQNGCKYDFTALSKYLTDLWNNSDQKFDEMVKLLEENNKYQQKLVDSLNEIKALLIADTVMDFFKDRSQETAEKAKDKFPTSIPWDISLVLNSMSAEPKNPKFSLPIKIESFKINETIDIDLSTDEWEKLAKTCRYILSVTFVLFLIHLSRKLFSNGGDD